MLQALDDKYIELEDYEAEPRNFNGAKIMIIQRLGEEL